MTPGGGPGRQWADALSYRACCRVSSRLTPTRSSQEPEIMKKKFATIATPTR